MMRGSLQQPRQALASSSLGGIKANALTRKSIPPASAQKASSRGGSSGQNPSSGRRDAGFGKKAPVPVPLPEPSAAAKKKTKRTNEEMVQEDLNEAPAGGQENSSFRVRTEYQVYRDADYKPPRTVQQVELKHNLESKGRGLTAVDPVIAGELLIVSSALVFMEGDWQTAPEAEDLQMFMLEQGLTAAQRRVLDMLYDGSEASLQKEASLSTIDTRFWSSRGKQDSQAPTISSSRLLSIIEASACSDTQQDGAVMTMRHQKPVGFIGLWPEYSLINHSCAPNTSHVVVKDRMLIHAGVEMERGEELTRNYIGPATLTPAPQRQKVLQDLGHSWTCKCERCQLEERVSPELQEMLQGAFDWYTEDALPRFNAAQSQEDVRVLQELLEEAQIIIDELEEAVTNEGGLTEREQVLLRASAYDCYDMVVLCDEFVKREKASPSNVERCLELLQIVAPGSESHTAVAQKYEGLLQQKYQLLRAALKQNKGARTSKALSSLEAHMEAATIGFEACTIAFMTRYGLASIETMESLREASYMFLEAEEQMSLMAAEGIQEKVMDYSINGVKVSVVDKMDLSSGSYSPNMPGFSSSSGLYSSPVKEDSHQGSSDDGMESGVWDTEGEGHQDGDVVEVMDQDGMEVRVIHRNPAADGEGRTDADVVHAEVVGGAASSKKSG